MQIKHEKFTLLCLLLCFINGFLSASDSIVEMISDPLKLVIYPKTGNFCLYHTQPDDTRYYAPLYDDRAQSSVNIYSLLFNGKMFHLNNKSGKKILIEQSKDAITVTFQISLDFLVTQTFSFIPSNQRSTGPLLKVVTEIQNISGDIASIALKAVFDAVLGEKNHIPIYTDLRSEIGSELMLQPLLEKDSVIFSADKGYACMFFLRHEDITPPTSVYIANWERLVTKTWLPSYVHGRSFRKYTVSDPGILYVWSEKKVENKDTLSVTNCIGFYDYRNSSDVDMRFETSGRTAAKEAAPSVPAIQTPPKKNTQKKDYRFVQELLDKISLLEQNTDELSTEKIRQLRKEVDNAIKALQEE